jgi:Zn finger protein HypA/HybF involved in hydrogenase expression
MGLQNISAKCSCGYTARKIKFGCTMMMMHENIEYTPAICQTCGNLDGVNKNDNPILCEKCYSSDIKIFGTKKMLGEEIKLDLSSEEFYKSYERYNDFFKNYPLKDGTFFSVTIEEYKYDCKERHRQRTGYSTPIFSHYNFCPSCEEYNLEFIPNSSHCD